jgi:hypothetical protein
VEGTDKSRVCQVLLPLHVFWDLEKLIKKADYMHATNEDTVVINDLYAQILRKAAVYTTLEKDRVWIHEKLSGP